MVVKIGMPFVVAAVLLTACGDSEGSGPSDGGLVASSTSVATAADAAPVTTDPKPTSGAAPSSTTAAPSSTTTTPSTTSAPSTTAAATTSPPSRQVIATSAFQGLAGHRGSGTATLVRDGDDHVVETRDTDIGSGPALIVYLVPGSDRRDLADAIVVADLVAESGDHDYAVPDTVDVSAGPWTLLVWCETFTVEVANATFEY